MVYNKLFQYYEKEHFLPTFGNFDSPSKLNAYAQARRTIFVEKLMLPIEVFRGAKMLEFGPDTGENALVFALWGANLTLVEPNRRAHPQIAGYFQRFGLHRSLMRLSADDLEGFKSDEAYDVVDAEGFIYTVQPTSLWLRVFNSHLKPGGYAIISYYEPRGTFIELVLKAVHAACKALTGLAPEPAAHMLYEAKWNSIPHTRAFGAWVRDVLENPFVRLGYFLDAAALCRTADEQGFDLHASWPLYRDALDIYWHKKALPAAELLARNASHLKRSSLSFLMGRKMYLVGSADEINRCAGLVDGLLADVDGLLEQPLGGQLAPFLSGLGELRQIIRTAGILVDDQAALEDCDALIAALEAIFKAVADKDVTEMARLTNSHPAFISTWGMPNHFLVLRKRFDASPKAL
jgi:hypothetical protein